MYYPYSYIRDNTPKYYIANQSAVKGLKRLTSIQLQIFPIKQLLKHSLIISMNVVFIC